MKKFNQQIQDQFDKMCKTGKLFRVKMTGQEVWDLYLKSFTKEAVSLETEHKESGKKSFLVAKSVKDKTAKLRFDIVLDVLTTKVEDAQVLTDALEIKEHNKKIIALIAEKQDESLKGKSIAQLEKMLK